MGWIRAHLYASTLALAGLLIITGIIIVQNRTPVDTTNSSMTWSGGSVSVYGVPENTAPSSIVSQIVQNQNPGSLVLSRLATSAPAESQQSSGSFDYAALLTRIAAQSNSSQPQSTQGQSTASILAQAYANVPQGFIATAAPTTRPMTKEQKALYDYGNEVGSIIQAFETAHTNETQVLKDQATDRTDPAKNAAVVALGKALAQIGTQMQGVSDVPSSVTSIHASLAQSYIDIGAKLQLVPQAHSDSDFAQAIKNYDATANIFVRNYATLAAYLAASGVVFSMQDPGSVFSFSAASGQ